VYRDGYKEFIVEEFNKALEDIRKERFEEF
jgi:hypothetical protein